MGLKKFKVEDLKPGMVFDQAVYVDENNIMAAPMVPIKEVDINRLIKWGIEDVETAGVVVKQVEEGKGKKRLHGDGDSSAQNGSDIKTVWDEVYGLVGDIFEKTRNNGSNKRLDFSFSLQRLC